MNRHSSLGQTNGNIIFFYSTNFFDLKTGWIRRKTHFYSSFLKPETHVSRSNATTTLTSGASFAYPIMPEYANEAIWPPDLSKKETICACDLLNCPIVSYLHIFFLQLTVISLICITLLTILSLYKWAGLTGHGTYNLTSYPHLSVGLFDNKLNHKGIIDQIADISSSAS